MVCSNPGHICGTLGTFSCAQMMTRMEVAYHVGQDDQQMSITNISLRSGCSCSTVVPQLYNQLQPGPREK